MPGPLAIADLPLVGRDVEMDTLQRAWKSAQAGERQMVLLAGEPGIGKTRLSAEAAKLVHESRAVVLYGRCDEGMGVSFQPFVEALGHLVDHTDGDGLADRLGRHPGELVRLVPEIATRLPAVEPPMHSDPETERYRLFDAVTSWLESTSAASGAVLVLDDLHWAEKPTLLLLHHLIRSSDPMRLLVIATYRDTDLDRAHPLSSLLADFRREPRVERMAVEGLDLDGVEAMMAAAAGHTLDDRGEALAGAIWAETEGNPFFIREVLRSLAESGVIYQRDGRWTSDRALEDLGIPEGVRDVIGRRLGRLSEQANQVLSVAAVVGSEVDLDVLVAVSSLDEDAVIDALDEAVRAHVVREAGVGRWQFAHALVRSTLYEELSVTRRARRHQQVAKYVEANRPDDAATLAFHYSRAGVGGGDVIAKAIFYAAAAGRAAVERLAPDQGIAFFRQALDLLEDAGIDDVTRRCELLIGLGVAQRNAGDPAHRETLLDAARLAEDAGDAGLLAQAATENGRGFASFAGRADLERLAVYEAAYRAIGPDCALRARVAGTLATEMIFSSRREERFALAEEAIALARKADSRTLADVLVVTGPPLSTPDRLEHSAALADELVDLARSLGDPRLQVYADVWAFFQALNGVPDMAILDAHIGNAVRVADEVGEPGLRWMATAFDTCRVALTGNLEAVERQAIEAFELGQQSGQPDAAEWFGAHLMTVRLDQGRFGEVIDAMLAYCKMYPDAPTWKATTALGLLDLGRTEEAATLLDEVATDGFAAVPYDYFWTVTVCNAAQVAVALGRRADAEVAFHLLAPYADRLSNFGIGPMSAVARVLGQIDTLLGRFDKAGPRFEQAVELHQGLGHDQYAAYSRLDWAAMLLQRDGDGDRGRARDLATHALEMSQRRGYAKAERLAREVLAAV